MSSLELEDLLARGDELRDAGDAASALDLYAKVVASAPGFAKGHYKLATAKARMGLSDEAEKSYREALRLSPFYVEAHGNLGVLLYGRGEWDEAERCYRNALANDPGYFEAHVNLSALLFVVSRFLESLYFARRAIELNPRSAIALERAGLALGRLGRVSESLAELRRATEMDPSVATPWMSLGSALQALGRDEESDAAYVSAIGVAKDDPVPCENRAFWSNYRQQSREAVWQLHRDVGRWIRDRLGPLSAPESPTWRPDPGRRLRVGFVSPDFRRHSVGYFVHGALGHLSRQQFQLHAYFDFHTEDYVTARLKPLFNQWSDIYSKTDDVVYDQIRRDRIDILVDLAGLSAGNRLRLFGRRPAPVQVTYLGYPNTTGLDCMDYRLTDRWADPDDGDDEALHSEALWRLPNSFLCYSAPLDALEVSEPPVLRNGFVTFGSFNNRIKISDPCLELWVRVLKEIPSSRLLLKSIQGTEDEGSREELRDRFVEHGIDASRVEVHGYVEGIDSHLGMYGRIDIALDTFPYNGTTTTCEALWMGVPVICLKGDRHAARVGESLLANVGLPELLARSPDDYLKIAGKFAADPRGLADLRSGLRGRMRASRLMDSRAIGLEIGEALRGMWSRYCSRFPEALPIESNVMESTTDLLRLHLGDGAAPDGWKAMAPDRREGVDFVGDLRALSSFRDDSCAEIYAAHVLQRLTPHDMLPALNDIHRILVPGGTLYLAVPDFDELIALYANTELSRAERFNVMRAIFGSQDESRDLHRIGLGFDFLEDYLADVGFTSVEHVESFGLFDDASEARLCGQRISLNLMVTK